MPPSGVDYASEFLNGYAPEYVPKQQNSLYLKQTVFLCVIMQPAAFLCVICAICGRINIQLTQSIYTNETPMSPADLADLRRQTTNPKTAFTSN